jgi:DNA-binding transcriptional regulator YiaG
VAFYGAVDGDERVSEALLLAELRRMTADGRALAIRETANMSLREVASAIGASASSVCAWERGITRPTGKRALRYRQLLLDLRALD